MLLFLLDLQLSFTYESTNGNTSNDGWQRASAKVASDSTSSRHGAEDDCGGLRGLDSSLEALR